MSAHGAASPAPHPYCLRFRRQDRGIRAIRLAHHAGSSLYVVLGPQDGCRPHGPQECAGNFLPFTLNGTPQPMSIRMAPPRPEEITASPLLVCTSC